VIFHHAGRVSAKGEQPRGRLAGTVNDGAIVGLHTDTQGIRNRELPVTNSAMRGMAVFAKSSARPVHN